MTIPYNTMQQYHEKVKKYLPGGVHYNFRLPWEETPLHIVNTHQSRVWDMDGNEYLDFHARFGALIVGHGNQEYNDSLKNTMDRVLSVSHSDLDAEVLALIAHYYPSAEMIRFGVSGTEIVQSALRLARAWTGKNRFVRFEGHYHGNADNIMGGKVLDPRLPIPSDYKTDIKGTAGRALGVLETQSYLLPWNNADVLEELLINHGDEIAAVITEPVCVNAGSIMPEPGYLEKMRQLCDDFGVVLIFDEIITGVRMGLGGAQKQFNVTPDLTTLGKAISGGGLPVGVLIGKKEIMQLLSDKKVIHAGTFNGYSLGLAAIKITLELLAKDNQAAMTQMYHRMMAIQHSMQTAARDLDLPLVIQGPLGCSSYHCSDQILRNTHEYTYDIMLRDVILNSNMSKNGILVSTVSRFYPNILLNQDDVDWFKTNIVNALYETQQTLDMLNSHSAGQDRLNHG